MREEAFRAWLQAGGAQTEAGRNSRVYAVRTIENQMTTLGSPHANLDDAFAADGLAQLRERLRQIRLDAKAGGQDYRVLMPESKKPLNRLSNWNSWLSQYGRFCSGEPQQPPTIDADRIRQYVLEQAIEPAREKGRDSIEVLVREVNQALGLRQAWPNICQALGGSKFQELADVPPPLQIGANQSSATLFRFDLSETGLTDAEVLARFDNIASFRSSRQAWSKEQTVAFCTVVRAVHEAGLDWWHVNIAPWQLRFGRKSSERARAEGVLGYILGEPPRVEFNRKALEFDLKGDQALDPSSSAAILEVLEQRNAEIRGWLAPSPRRLGRWPDDFDIESPNPFDSQDTEKNATMPDIEPTNLILYGPPGTGKTYATAAEAVRLCDVAADYPDTWEGRAALMVRYHELVKAKRIAFVTFHQNFSYEDFIEGLRPTQGSTDAGPGGGFSLRPEDGIFKQIVKWAQTSVPAGNGVAFSLNGRAIYKMSLGQSGTPAGEWVFEESIANGYALFSYGCIDWTEGRFAQQAEILSEAQAHRPDQTVTASHGIVKCTHIFRNQLNLGDVLIISRGLTSFRAIGIVEGEYEYAPRDTGDYCHRRKVRWLWQEPDGVPIQEISDTKFNMDPIHSLKSAKLSRAAIERYINSGIEVDNREIISHVLIIDEINRANNSKVFGEIITLIEPDKRLEMVNCLTVTLPYSKEIFGVPANLHVIGTMNTADRSIALLDTALRRRFQFREIEPEPARLTEAETRTGVPLVKLLATINDRIEYLIDREHRIGHAFFMACDTRDGVDAVMRDKVIPLLQEYFFEDWSRIHAVLGDGFIGKRDLLPPPGMESDPRPSWFVCKSFPANAYTRLIGGKGLRQEADVMLSSENEDAPM